VHISELNHLQRQVIACQRCPRLIRYCRKVAVEKRRRYQQEGYWGRPVPSFGDPAAALLIVGLAPGAHGSNRTGRMFTGDRSGEFLYRALHEAGFANQPGTHSADDGLELRNCYITAVARCAPPQNKPLPAELRNCQPYFEKELELLTGVRAVLALGRVAFDAYLRVVKQRGAGLRPGVGQADRHPGQRPSVEQEAFPPRASFRFTHGASYALPNSLPRLFASYHPSQQNTQTGKLTAAMFRQVLDDIHHFLEKRR
jgi:uracil-DNA glycosylase